MTSKQLKKNKNESHRKKINNKTILNKGKFKEINMFFNIN